jgi:hypothetical protein
VRLEAEGSSGFGTSRIETLPHRARILGIATYFQTSRATFICASEAEITPTLRAENT